MLEFLLFIVVIILLFWIASVSNRVSSLEKKFGQGKAVSPSTLSALEDKVDEDTGFLHHKKPVASMAVEMPMPKPVAEKTAAVPMTEARATEITSNWLNKIGVVALLLGMVFFFKYAIDQGWINPWMRVIIGFVISGLLVYLGELWKEKYGQKAQALSGGGIALFYFTIFAAYQFYALIPQPIAWALMLIVAALSIWLSFRYSSLVLGILGFFGAYGSPLMLSSGRDQQVSLFMYLTVMNVVALVICIKKFWAELAFLALLGTVIDYAAWAGHYSNQANTFTSVFFIISTTALIVLGCAGLIRYHKNKNNLPELLEQNLGIIYIFAGASYFFGVWQLLENNFHNFLAPIALLGAVIFFFAYAVVDRLEYRALNYCLSFVGSGLLVYAAIWQYNGKSLAFALLLISLLGASIGFLLKREELRVWGLIVLFMSLFKSLFEPYGINDKVFLFNAKFGLMFANTLAMLFVGWLYGKFKPSEFEKNVEGGLQIIAALVLWLAVSWDIFSGLSGFGSDGVQNYMTFWWVIYPVALAVAAFAGKRVGLMKVSLLLVFAGLVKVLILPHELNSAFLFNAKFGLMFAQTLALFTVGIFYSKSEDNSEVPDVLNVIASLLLWFAVSWEITEYFNGYQSVNARNLLLSLWWVIYAVVLMAAGGMLKKPVFRKVSILLFALSILKVFLYDVQALDTPYRIVAFIVLGVILLSVSFAYQTNKKKIVGFLEGDTNEIKNNQ
jgi:hypothetical protein